MEQRTPLFIDPLLDERRPLLDLRNVGLGATPHDRLLELAFEQRLDLGHEGRRVHVARGIRFPNDAVIQFLYSVTLSLATRAPVIEDPVSPGSPTRSSIQWWLPSALIVVDVVHAIGAEYSTNRSVLDELGMVFRSVRDGLADAADVGVRSGCRPGDRAAWSPGS